VPQNRSGRGGEEKKNPIVVLAKIRTPVVKIIVLLFLLLVAIMKIVSLHFTVCDPLCILCVLLCTCVNLTLKFGYCPT
jgi:hypothetical protein